MIVLHKYLGHYICIYTVQITFPKIGQVKQNVSCTRRAEVRSAIQDCRAVNKQTKALVRFIVFSSLSHPTTFHLLSPSYVILFPYPFTAKCFCFLQCYTTPSLKHCLMVQTTNAIKVLFCIKKNCTFYRKYSYKFSLVCLVFNILYRLKNYCNQY